MAQKAKAKKTRKTKSGKISPNQKRHQISDSSDEEEIPMLIPIEGTAVPKKGINSKDETSLDVTKKSVLSCNGKSSKKPTEKNKTLKKSSKKPELLDHGYSTVFNPVTQGLAIFKWLIDPILPKKFFDKYWEKDVLHIERENRRYFKDIFSTEELDIILREYPLFFTRNIDVVEYKNGKKELVEEEGRAAPVKVWDFYSSGCSVRVLNPHTYSQNVHSVISSLQEYFGTMVGTNVYLTPPESQGFAPHFDDIEAFIVQLEGSKYWKLYKPKGSDVLARDSSKNFSAEELDDPFMEVKLNAGDLLYFPRGTIHEGHTKEQHSLHITISVYQHTAYADLLEHALPAALKKAASENLEFRKGLPLNYLKHVGVVNQSDDSDKRKSIIDKVKSLVGALVDYIDVDSAADNLGRKFMHDAMPPLYSGDEAQHSCLYDGDVMKNGKVFHRVEITPEIEIRLLRYYALRVVKDSTTTSKLYFCTHNDKVYHGEEEQWLEISNSLLPAIEVLQKSYPNFVVADSLPIEDETAKLSLVFSLWEHGLLVTNQPLPGLSEDDETSSTDSDPSTSE
ncbi:hypothetical protein D910_12403 [Dendroctonus ponderosae]|uniref:Bifunctional lysine-specific demethylase and histidyl-hydroxylase n=2 Tax=Dendroctonus ponderosae TaxID=77166 RepID=U4URJ3_DENPD|nr:hypothetical protein D910_12403 [Dendroctonus ponderosae]